MQRSVWIDQDKVALVILEWYPTDRFSSLLPVTGLI